MAVREYIIYDKNTNEVTELLKDFQRMGFNVHRDFDFEFDFDTISPVRGRRRIRDSIETARSTETMRRR